MSTETRNVLLYGQLQSGLTLELSKATAVSGARNYDEPCIAAKNEEKRLAELEVTAVWKKPVKSQSIQATTTMLCL